MRKRETVCSCEVVMEPSLSQALHLLNGDTTNNRIKQGKVVDTSLKEGKKPDQIIDELYLRCYSRKPREAEKANLLASLDMSNPREGLEDVFLGSTEFQGIYFQSLNIALRNANNLLDM